MTSTGSVVGFKDVRSRGRNSRDSPAGSGRGSLAVRPAHPRVRAYLIGLLGPVPRKNSWQLARADRRRRSSASNISWAAPDPGLRRGPRRSPGYVGAPSATGRRAHPGRDGVPRRRALTPPGWPASTPAPPGGSRTARSGCSWPTASRHGTAFLDRGAVPARGVGRRPEAVCERGRPPGDGRRDQAPIGQGDARAGVRGRSAGGLGHLGDEARRQRRRPAARGRGGAAAVRAGGPGQPRPFRPGPARQRSPPWRRRCRAGPGARSRSRRGARGRAVCWRGCRSIIWPAAAGGGCWSAGASMTPTTWRTTWRPARGARP